MHVFLVVLFHYVVVVSFPNIPFNFIYLLLLMVYVFVKGSLVPSVPLNVPVFLVFSFNYLCVLIINVARRCFVIIVM